LIGTWEVVFYWQLALNSATRCSRIAIAACNKQLPTPSHHDRCVIVYQANMAIFNNITIAKIVNNRELFHSV